MSIQSLFICRYRSDFLFHYERNPEFKDLSRLTSPPPIKTVRPYSEFLAYICHTYQPVVSRVGVPSLALEGNYFLLLRCSWTGDWDLCPGCTSCVDWTCPVGGSPQVEKRGTVPARCQTYCRRPTSWTTPMVKALNVRRDSRTVLPERNQPSKTKKVPMRSS